MTAEDSRFPDGYNGRLADRLPRKYEFFQDFYASLFWQRGFSMFQKRSLPKSEKEVMVHGKSGTQETHR
jgi:hypothetical protein